MSQNTPDMPEELGALFVAVEHVLQQHSLSFEDLCTAYAQAFRMDAAETGQDGNVTSLLESAADALDRAGMDWYVSRK